MHRTTCMFGRAVQWQVFRSLFYRILIHKRRVQHLSDMTVVRCNSPDLPKPSASAGAHGAFQAAAIDAATLRLLSADDGALPADGPADAADGSTAGRHFAPSLGRESGDAALVRLAEYLEEYHRALNNLIERFHHSQPLYALTSSGTYVGGDGIFLPAVFLMVSLLLRGVAQKQRVDAADALLFESKPGGKAAGEGAAVNGSGNSAVEARERVQLLAAAQWLAACRHFAGLVGLAAALYVVISSGAVYGLDAVAQWAGFDGAVSAAAAWGLLLGAPRLAARIVHIALSPGQLSEAPAAGAAAGIDCAMHRTQRGRLQAVAFSCTAIAFAPILVLKWALAYCGMLLATGISIAYVLPAVRGQGVRRRSFALLATAVWFAAASATSPVVALALMAGASGECFSDLGAASSLEPLAACAWSALPRVPHLNVAAACSLLPLWAIAYL